MAARRRPVLAHYVSVVSWRCCCVMMASCLVSFRVVSLSLAVGSLYSPSQFNTTAGSAQGLQGMVGRSCYGRGWLAVAEHQTHAMALLCLDHHVTSRPVQDLTAPPLAGAHRKRMRHSTFACAISVTENKRAKRTD